MKTAEQIAEEFTGPCTCHEAYTSRKRTDPQCQYHNDYESLVVVLRQYGAAVRQRAADLTLKRTGYAPDAAAIERMELP